MRDYYTEKLGWIAFFVGQMCLVAVLGRVFRVSSPFVISALFLEGLAGMLMFGVDFWKKYKFYKEVYEKLEELDKKYLITELIQKPGFWEGNTFCDVLYETDRSMNERVNEQESSVREFKDYVEMWIHEIKLPISALSLMNQNKKTDFRSYQKQVDKISHYVEQILYYVRADAPQKDFLMKQCNVEKMVNEVLLEHKDVLISGKFTIEKKGINVDIVSDAKWVKFMLGQLLDNSIKYKRGESGYLGFEVQEEQDSVILCVEDHGIGVSAGDLKQVFDKSFTGKNGRKVVASTGMGLYICRKMCRKLGHEIWMESVEGEFTKVMIRFGKNGYYVE